MREMEEEKEAEEKHVSDVVDEGSSTFFLFRLI